MTRLVKFFYRFLYFLVPIWYGLTVALTRKRRYPPVQTYAFIEDIPRAFDFGTRWRPDPVKGALDVLMNPRKFQERINTEAPDLGDCDDHALYIATSLLKSRLCQKAYLGTVWYTRSNGKSYGHVVCVFEDRRGDTYWMDYNTPSRTIGDFGWAIDMCQKKRARLHAAAYFEVTLRRNGEPRLRKRSNRKTWK